MLRHLRSLRTMSRDNGWIHTLLEEAENERMHLLTFMQLRNPGIMFRAAVIAGQGAAAASWRSQQQEGRRGGRPMLPVGTGAASALHAKPSAPA